MSNFQAQKVAVITGASHGLGAGLVTGYRKLGYSVVATARTMSPSGDADVVTVGGDIADPSTAEQVIAAGMERFGRIDTLVNNAGIFISKPFTDYTRDDFDAMIAVNVAGFFYLTRLAVPHMLERGGGHIVNITTSLVDHANSKLPSVLASLTKGGLQAATKSLAIEYAQQGIRCNAVSPGHINTPLNPEDVHEFLAGLEPVGHLGERSDVVDAVLYLEGAPFVTGEILHVDGGQSAGH